MLSKSRDHRQEGPCDAGPVFTCEPKSIPHPGCQERPAVQCQTITNRRPRKDLHQRACPQLGPFPPWGLGLGCTPSHGFTAHDDPWQKVRRFQTSRPPVSIVIKFRRSPAWRSGSTQRVVCGLVDVMSPIHGAQRPSHSAGGDQGGLHSRIWGTIANVPPRQCGDVRPFPVPRSPQRLTSACRWARLCSMRAPQVAVPTDIA